MTVVVFGATGFVGRNLVQALVAEGREVIAVSARGGPAPGARPMAMGELDSLGPLPADAVVVHLAAERYDAGRFAAAQSDILVSNTDITNRIYAFCVERRIGEVRLASSVAVYPASLPVLDDAAPIDLNGPPHAGEAFYGWSKRWGEIVAQLYSERYGVSTVAFRLSNPYGPNDSTDPLRAHVLPAFVMRALAPGPTFSLKGDPEVERDFVYVGDVVEVLRRSLDWRGRNDRINLCSGRSTTLRALAQAVIAAAGVNKTLALDSDFAPAAVKARPTTAARLKAAFGLDEFTPLERGLPPTVAWYREALRA